MPAAPSFYHGRLVSRLFQLIAAHLSPLHLGDNLFTAPVDVQLPNLRVVQPDILYVGPDRPEAFARPPVIQGPPDLVAEVISSSNRHHDQVVKFGYYEQAEVREYWLLDAENETLTLYPLTAGRLVEQPNKAGIARSVVLPGLEIDVAALFADLA